jgi:hypothetical protein
MFAVFFPFMICDAFEDNILFSLLCLIVPFAGYPIVAYFNGVYQYGGEEIEFY